MRDTVRKAVIKQYGTQPESVEDLGGGFYGRVFLASLNCAPFRVVLKLYLFPGLAEKEAEQTETLSRYALLKMPRIYQVLKKEQTGFAYDILFMEYLEGVNAGNLDTSGLPEASRNAICEDIVDNLIACHQGIRLQGFGGLSSERCCTTWQEYYYPIACNAVGKARVLAGKGQISHMILSVFEQSIKQFHDIFHLPITQARLIHGDYNTWNIMVDEERTHAVAAIDPFGCCWADSEFDLYQLDNANGKGYGLLKRYAEKVPLSVNFEEKRRFYELYTEVSHYHDACVTVNQQAVEELARRLKEVL